MKNSSSSDSVSSENLSNCNKNCKPTYDKSKNTGIIISDSSNSTDLSESGNTPNFIKEIPDKIRRKNFTAYVKTIGLGMCGNRLIEEDYDIFRKLKEDEKQKQNNVCKEENFIDKNKQDDASINDNQYRLLKLKEKHRYKEAMKDKEIELAKIKLQILQILQLNLIKIENN